MALDLVRKEQICEGSPEILAECALPANVVATSTGTSGHDHFESVISKVESAQRSLGSGPSFLEACFLRGAVCLV